MIIAGSAILANGQIINTNLTTESNSILVEEVLTIDDPSNENITFWIQSEATDINITFNGNTIEYEAISDNTYSCNMSGLDFTKYTPINVTYSLIKDVSKFRKTLMYNTTSISIEFDGKEIYAGGNLPSGSFLIVALQGETTETKTETTTIEKAPTWYYIILIILIILVILSFIFPSKKQKTTKKKETTTGSEELLNTKKTLLMELLKDIEKQHRAKQISDDTYHKLKEQYKQEAVDAMKKLEDMKSKVK